MTTTKSLSGLILFVACVFRPWPVTSREICTPDVIIVNAKVHTVDPAKPSAQAVAVCGELIGRVGSTDEVRALAGAKTRIIDAQGRLLLQSPEALERSIFAADAAGFQVIVHAIGDRANAIVLDVFEKLQRERGPRDRRPRIEHAQVVRRADQARFHALGVIASIQPSHVIDDMRWAETRIGRERSRIAYNFKSFVDAGARIAFGTDWYVEPLNPMLGLYAAVTRQFPDGTPAGGWFPDERISMAQAIEFYTLGSAYAEFAEASRGSITEGKLADLVIWSKDALTVPPRELLDTKPIMTMVGGRIVHGG